MMIQGSSLKIGIHLCEVSTYRGINIDLYKSVKEFYHSRHFHFQMKKIQRQKIIIIIIILNFDLNFIILYTYVGNFHYLPYFYICLYKYYIHTSLGHQVFCSIFTCHVSRFSRRTQVFSREKRCPHLQNINSFYFFF